MAQATNRSAAAHAQSPNPTDVESAAIQIDAVITAMAAVADTCGSPTDYILWAFTYALNDSLRLLGQEVRS